MPPWSVFSVIEHKSVNETAAIKSDLGLSHINILGWVMCRHPLYVFWFSSSNRKKLFSGQETKRSLLLKTTCWKSTSFRYLAHVLQVWSQAAYWVLVKPNEPLRSREKDGSYFHVFFIIFCKKAQLSRLHVDSDNERRREKRCVSPNPNMKLNEGCSLTPAAEMAMQPQMMQCTSLWTHAITNHLIIENLYYRMHLYLRW